MFSNSKSWRPVAVDDTTYIYIVIHSLFRCRLNTYGRRAFSIVGPTVLNSLPRELRDPACGFDSFKQFLKTILFSLY